MRYVYILLVAVIGLPVNLSSRVFRKTHVRKKEATRVDAGRNGRGCEVARVDRQTENSRAREARAILREAGRSLRGDVSAHASYPWTGEP